MRLDSHERELFAEVVESSLRVMQRHQFYGWTQGIVQSLVPHEILICSVDDGSRSGMNVQYFSGSRYFHFNAVPAPREGLLSRMIDAWQSTGEAFLLAPGLAGCAESGALLDLVQRNELRNIAAHGVHGTNGRGLVGFYGFSRISGELGPNVAYRAELVVP
jgi:hypothetical protein